MKKMLKQLLPFVILVPGLTFCFSCQKDSNPQPSFSAPGFWMGSFFAGATLAILNRPDGTGRAYVLTILGQDTASPGVKLDGTFNVKGDIFTANYIDTSGTVFINLQSSRTTTNSMDGVFFLKSSTTASNTIESFNFQLVKQ
jgi:hypothetical protein